MSNDGYGAIRQTNKTFFDGKYIGCDKKSGISFPDFSMVADAFDIQFKRCENCINLEDSVKWLIERDGPAILEIYQKLDDPTSPKLMSKLMADGSFETPALQDLWPYISDTLMKELMPDWEI